jgi:HlyD family secretion protein
MKSARLRCLLSTGGLALLAWPLVLAASPPACAADEPAPKKPASRVLKINGHVEALEQVQLYARVVGFVQRWTADLGDHVKKGQVLAELALPEMQAEADQKRALAVQAEAEVKHAQAVLVGAGATVALTTAGVQQAEAGVVQAKSQLKYAQATVERLKTLLEKGNVTPQVVDEKEQQAAMAQAAVAEAEAKVESARASRAATAAHREAAAAAVKAAEARLQAARADLVRQQVLLGYGQIRAPFDGVVTHRTAVVGELAGPPGVRGQPLYIVTRTDVLRVVVDVSEADLPRVRVGEKVLVQFTALPGRKLHAKVARTAGVINRARSTLRVEIDLPNQDGLLLPGMNALVTFALRD